jgi:pilus assembly protein CpaE
MSARGTSRDSSLTALLIGGDRDLAQQLLASLEETHSFEVLSDLKGYPNEPTLEMRLRQIQPEVVFMDLATDFEAANRLIHFVSTFQPPTQVVGYHSANDPDILIRSLRAGATEFLWAPFDKAAQKEAAARIQRLRQPEGRIAQESGKVLAFSSAKPGAGATTLATQTAFAIRRLTGKKVLLADFDLFGGAISFSLKLNPTYSLIDALERSEHMDPALWVSLTAPCCGIDVLAAPDAPVSDSYEFSRFHEVIEYSRMMYDWVVIDLPTVFHRLSLYTIAEVDQSMLVTTSELPSLHLSRRAVSMLAQLGYTKDRFQVVVNRSSRKDGISVADMERIFSASIFATCPNDYYPLHAVVTRGEPLDPNCELGRAIENLTSKVAGLTQKDRRLGPAALDQKPVLLES